MDFTGRDILAIMLALVWCMVALMIVANIVTYHLFTRRLRREHSQTWEELGRPSLIMTNSIATGLAVRKYVKQKHYRALDDLGLQRLVAVWNWTGRLAFALAALSFGLFILLG